jgi:hypothetical protein
MSRKNRKPGRPQAAKRVWVEPIQCKEINRRKLARAVLRLAMEESEHNSEAESRAIYAKGDQPNGKEKS